MGVVLRGFLCFALVISSSFYSFKSEALVGLATWKSKTMTIGGATAVTGVVSAPLGLVVAAGSWNSIVVANLGLLLMYTGMGLVAGGVIILEEDSFRFYYQTLDQHEAQALDLTVSEWQAFNSHVSVFNAIMDDVWELPETTDFEAVWISYADELAWDDHTRSALAKVASAVVRGLTDANL